MFRGFFRGFIKIHILYLGNDEMEDSQVMRMGGTVIRAALEEMNLRSGTMSQ